MSFRPLGAFVPHIHWHDGLSLLPHHFQLAALRAQQIVARCLHLSDLPNWGVQSLAFDNVVLPNGLIRLISADIVLPDGEILSFDARLDDSANTFPPVEVDLSAHKPSSSRDPVWINLALPARKPGQSPLLGSNPRYRVVDGFPTADENTGDNAVDIPRLLPCLQLSVGENLPPHHVGFPIAKVFFVDGAFKMGDFTPPCFSLDPDASLLARCRQTVRKVREKALALSEKWQNQVGTSLLRETADMLRPLVTVLPSLEAIVTAPRAHPLTVTRTFLEAAGVISQLDLANVPPRFPAYNHNNIDASIDPILSYIEQSLARLSTEYAIFPFKKNDPFFSFKLNKVLCAGAPELFVGLRAKPGIQAPQIEAWMKDAIIVSDEALQKVQSKRIIGAPRQLLEGDKLYEMSPPRDMTLFAIELDSQFVLPGQYLHIFNPSDSEYERPAEIMLYVHKMDSIAYDEAA